MTRRERAIERAYDRDPINWESLDPLPWDELLLECYEAELAADLESEETLQRVLDAYEAALPDEVYSHLQHEVPLAAPMRAALKAAREER